MKEELEQKLFEEFFFRDDNKSARIKGTFYCECDDGWYQLLKNLFTEIKLSYNKYDNTPSIVIDQIKEKFGTLRFYYHFEGNPIALHAIDILNTNQSVRTEINNTEFEQSISNIIDNFENKSATICEVCGDVGILRTDLMWISTLCDKHYNIQLNK